MSGLPVRRQSYLCTQTWFLAIRNIYRNSFFYFLQKDEPIQIILQVFCCNAIKLFLPSLNHIIHKINVFDVKTFVFYMLF